ncbi:MAG: flavin reductase family protein [Phycisphaerales bacterium]
MKVQTNQQNPGNEHIESALSLLPIGNYLMTAAYDGQRSGMLVSGVQCCCREPAMLCVSARKGHKIDPLIRDSRTFAIGIVAPNDKLILRRFTSNDSPPDEHEPSNGDDAFDAMPTKTLVTGAPVLTRCATWFDCEVMRRVDLEAESELFVGLIVAIYHNGERIEIDRPSDEHG